MSGLFAGDIFFRFAAALFLLFILFRILLRFLRRFAVMIVFVHGTENVIGTFYFVHSLFLFIVVIIVIHFLAMSHFRCI